MGHKKQENTGWMGKLFLNDSDKKMPDTLKYKKFIIFFTKLKNHIRLIEINSWGFLNKGQWQTTELPSIMPGPVLEFKLDYCL